MSARAEKRRLPITIDRAAHSPGLIEPRNRVVTTSPCAVAASAPAPFLQIMLVYVKSQGNLYFEEKWVLAPQTQT